MNIEQAVNNVPTIQNVTSLQKETAQSKKDNVKKEQTITKAIQKEVSKEDVAQAVDELNEFIETSLRSVRFEFHEDLNKYYVKVIDSQTDEIVREIPPEKMLDMHAAMLDYIGLLVDEKV